MRSFGAMHVPALLPSLRATRNHGAKAGGLAGMSGGLPVLLSRALGLAFAAVTIYGLVFYVLTAVAKA